MYTDTLIVFNGLFTEQENKRGISENAINLSDDSKT